jgi:hypothetical protein
MTINYREAADDFLDALFGTASLTPSQWLDLHRPRSHSGERDLIVAVLEGAIRQYLAKPKQRAEALAWFAATEGPFSFTWCAEAIDMEPEMLRAAVTRFLARCESGDIAWAKRMYRGPWLRDVNQASTQPLVGRGKYRKRRALPPPRAR